MRKVLFVLAALLIATPAMAVPHVDITCTQQEGGWVTIGYDVTRGAEEPRLRAVALDVSVNVGAIVAIHGYIQGESVYNANPALNNKGFGIFPGSINLADPEHPVWGDPIAPAEDKGADGTGIGTQRVILEMGSLYDGSVPANIPDDTGVLCQLRLFVSSGAVVTVVEEKAHRGGIVMETPAAAVTTNVSSPTVLCSPVWTYTGPEAGNWDYAWVGSPPYWAAANQCYGDSDAQTEPFGRGNVAVGMQDAYILIAGFRKEAYGVDLSENPLGPWSCNPTDCPWIAADFDHIHEVFGRGRVRVGMLDAYILIDYFRNLSNTPQGDCQVP